MPRSGRALVETAREIVPADKVLIVGTGAESTRTCLQQTRDAAARGADAVLVVAPHYYGAAMTADALRAHYRRVADESPVPVVLYSIPKYMHFSLPPALVAELAAHENVIGIKDSSGQRDQLAAYLESQSDSFAVLDGERAAVPPRAHGGRSRAAFSPWRCSRPAVTLDVYNRSSQGDEAAATPAQARLTPLGAKIVGELGVPGVKAAMDQVGLSGGPVRLPLQPLGAGAAARGRRAAAQRGARRGRLVDAASAHLARIGAHLAPDRRPRGGRGAPVLRRRPARGRVRDQRTLIRVFCIPGGVGDAARRRARGARRASPVSGARQHPALMLAALRRCSPSRSARSRYLGRRGVLDFRSCGGAA